jgi:hypothetical protein
MQGIVIANKILRNKTIFSDRPEKERHMREKDNEKKTPGIAAVVLFGVLLPARVDSAEPAGNFYQP